MNEDKPKDFEMKLLPKQKKVFFSKADAVLFGGGAGSAKSACLKLMAIYFGYNQPNLQIYLFRRTYPEINSTFLTGEFSFRELLQPYINQQLVKINQSKLQIEFSNGAIIHLCHCQAEKDMYRYQGSQIGVLMIDEAGTFTESIYRYLKSRVRIAHEIRPEFKDILPKIVLTANPDGPLMSFLKRNFVNFCDNGKVTLYDKEFRETREYIPATLEDNPYLRDTDYAENLKSLGSPALVQSYLNGDWSIALDSFFDGSFSEKNIVSPFKIPNNWNKYRGMDWGWASPFSVLWMAESNGETITIKGKPFNTVRGDKFIFMEYYGDTDGDEKGLRLTAEEVAENIKKYENESKNSLYSGIIKAGAADSSIWTKESNGSCVANNLRKAGVDFIPCTKGTGSRVNGWQNLISLMRNANAESRERPGLFIFNKCKRLIDHIKTISRDPKKLDDIDTNAADHDLDALSYICRMTKNVAKSRQF